MRPYKIEFLNVALELKSLPTPVLNSDVDNQIRSSNGHCLCDGPNTTKTDDNNTTIDRGNVNKAVYVLKDCGS